jgi:hypothetical protein
MESFVEPIAATVPGEHAAGPVGSVRGGGKSHDEEANPAISERRDRSSPVGLIGESARLFACYFLAMRDHPRAETTRGNVVIDRP